MRNGSRIAVVIPALNEAHSIGHVLDALPRWVDDVVVADNGSTDGTPGISEKHGARVVHAARRGYGSACLAGIDAVANQPPDVVVFLDGDYSDNPEHMDALVGPIVRGDADFVVGSRVLGTREPGALSPQSRWGNALACTLMRLFWRSTFTDLGPFRAIRYDALQRIEMRDPDFGWTVEMQLKALAHGLRCLEVPVDYRRRLVGKSKVSGTIRGVLGAGYKILSQIARQALRDVITRQPIRTRLRVLLFTRYPAPGQSKTRLIPALGPEGAAKLHRELTEHSLLQLRRFGAAEIEVCYSGGDDTTMRGWLGEGVAVHAQCDGDLGARMRDAFERAFADGASHVLIAGSDCPDLGPETYRAAFEALAQHDAVIGPAVDGGYYLVGIRQRAWPAAATLFDGIEWGTERVFQQTLDRAAIVKLDLARTAPLEDVDTPQDLAIWERVTHEPRDTPRCSVIIPTLNAGPRFTKTLATVAAEAGIEIIIVDGGSTDGTIEQAQALGARVLQTDPGRAHQMNVGSACASADVLLFLHSDTTLPAQYSHEIESALASPGAIAGAFRFATDFKSRPMQMVEWFTNLRARRLQLPYGDQGLFIRTSDFRRLGGFREMPIMDDFEFVVRVRRMGRIVCTESAAVTSGGRWKRLGVWRTMIRNQAVVAMYYCGVPLDTLARFYRRGAGE